MYSDQECPNKMHERSPLILEWLNNMICAKYKKKGHFVFNCPPEYICKIRKIPQKKSSLSYNSESKHTILNEQAANVNKFAGILITCDQKSWKKNLDTIQKLFYIISQVVQNSPDKEMILMLKENSIGYSFKMI